MVVVVEQLGPWCNSFPAWHIYTYHRGCPSHGFCCDYFLLPESIPQTNAKMQQFYITQKGRHRHESEIRNTRRTVATKRRATTAMRRRKKSMVRARVGHCSMPLDVVRVIVESAITVYYPTTKNRREKLTRK